VTRLNRVQAALFLWGCLAAAALGADVKVSGDTKVDAGKMARLKVDAPAEKAVIWDVFPEGRADVEELDGGRLLLTGPAGTYTVKARVIGFDGKKATVDTGRATVVIGTPAPEPPPVPPGPDPGPTPPPGPVTSFRVVLVYESGDTLTAKQNAVLYGKDVEAYLAARCGKTGWGRRDKDTDPAADTTDLKDVWAAVKPKLTSTPCFAIAANGVVTLEPFPATPADAVALLKRYAGDK